MKRLIGRASIEPLEDRAYFALIAFEPATLLPAGQYPSGLAVTDLNADGHVDIVETNYGDGTVGILMGHGDGTFAPMVAYPVGNGPEAVIVGDFNGDGIPDLIVANSGQNTLDTVNTNANSISVLLGQGDGTFAPATTFATGVGPVSIVSADFNGDGHLDIATTNLLDNTITILNGNGDGTFAAAVSYDTGPRPQGLAVADFNRDGHPDLVTANSAGATVAVFINKGDGTFKTRVSYDVGNYPRALLAQDLGHSGRISIVATNLEDATFSILHGNNDGTFNNQSAIVSGVNPFGIAAADLNGDNRTDIVTANGNGTLSVRQRFSDGYTGDRRIFDTGQGPQNVAIADVNGDGKPDLISTDFADGTVGVLLNDTPRPGEKKTTTKLVTAPNPARLDETLTLTATVRSSSGKPTGTVAFYDNGASIGSAALDATGHAVFTTTTLPSGLNTLTAQYIGNGKFGESVSRPTSQVVTTSPASGPDLTATFDATGVGAEFVPGESASATFRITNQGDQRAKGTVESSLFLSTDGTLTSATPMKIAGNLASAFIKLKPGQSTSLSATFTVPAGLAVGQYAIVADVNSGATLAETDTSNNVGSSYVTYQLVNKFGVVGGISNVTLTLADNANTPVTFRLSGPGTANVDPTPNGLDVTITDTTSDSTLTIATPTGRLPANLHTLTDDSAIGIINAPVANFTGPINLSGGATTITLNNLNGQPGAPSGLNLGGTLTKSITLGSIAHASLSMTSSGIKSLSVVSWENTPDDRITAGYVGTLSAAGTFGPAVQITGVGAKHALSLKSLTVGAFVGQASVVGRVAAFVDKGAFAGTFAAARFGSISIHDSFAGDILAGADLGNDVALGGGDDVFGIGVIGSLHVGGEANGLVGAGLDPVNDVLLDGGKIGSIGLGSATATSRFVAATLPAQAGIGGKSVNTAKDARFRL